MFDVFQTSRASIGGGGRDWHPTDNSGRSLSIAKTTFNTKM
jgi:hypothetical protein